MTKATLPAEGDIIMSDAFPYGSRDHHGGPVGVYPVWSGNWRPCEKCGGAGQWTP